MIVTHPAPCLRGSSRLQRAQHRVGRFSVVGQESAFTLRSQAIFIGYRSRLIFIPYGNF